MFLPLQISQETQDLLIEVTSTVSLDTCKKVLHATLQAMLEMGLGQNTAAHAQNRPDDDDEDDGIVFQGQTSGVGTVT